MTSMKNLQQESIEATNHVCAKSLLEDHGRQLLRMTNGVVSGTVRQMDPFIASNFLGAEFVYSFELRRKLQGNYDFGLMTFSHDRTLYPVIFRMDEEVADELAKTHRFDGCDTTVDSPRELEELLCAAFQTKRIQALVRSIMRMSR